MAIFHYTVKIVGRSKGKSIISASAYLNGDVMKNEETGRISYYTSKREVVYTSLMMCENAPQEWQNVPAENIKRFQKSVRYKRADNKEVVLEKFKLTFQKQCLWNEVLKIEKSSDAQLGRSFEFSLPKEWNRQEQIEYTTDYIQKNFVDKGMCADWSIHDKGDGNPHVHLLVTMRPFNPDHSWGNKEVKDWEFVRDTDGNIPYILTPGFDEQIVRYALEKKIEVLPGVLTPSEVQAAVNCGIHLAKLFPADAFSDRYIKALKGPFPEMDYVAVGGVTPENAVNFYRLGYKGVAAGSNLVPKHAKRSDLKKIRETARKYVEVSQI